VRYLATIFAIMIIGFSSAYAGSAELSWDCPSCEIDGVSSFVIRYGSASNLSTSAPEAIDSPLPYESILVIDDPSARSVIINVVPGSWYFRLSAKDSAGNESTFSSEVGINIPVSSPSNLSGEVK